jgi:Ca-activated chloride channel family protein
MREPRWRWLVPYGLIALIGAPLAIWLHAMLDDARHGEDVDWKDPWALILLGGCALLAWVGFHLHRQRSATMAYARVVEWRLVRSGTIANLRSLPAVLRVLAVAAVVLALARPQTYREEDIVIKGIDIMIVLDMSRSMEEADLSRDRLDAAQRTIRNFIAGRKGDRIGLVVFGERTMVQCPLTSDRLALDQIVADLALGDVPDLGTAIGDGLALGLVTLRRGDASSSVVILLSDGDNNIAEHFEPEEASAMAKEMKVKVFTVLVGEVRTGWLGGNAVNPELMTSIAQDTGGRFFRVGDDESLARSFQAVSKTLDKTEHKTTSRIPNAELFIWFALTAAALLAVERVLALTRWRRFP